MDEYTKTQLKNFVREAIPDHTENQDNSKNALPPNQGLMNNVIIGNHNLILSNAVSLMVLFATVLCAVAFFY